VKKMDKYARLLVKAVDKKGQVCTVDDKDCEKKNP